LCDRRSNDIAVGSLELGGFGVALADLACVAIVDERAVQVRPARQQRLAPAGRQREIHPGRGAEPRRRVVIARMEEVAVPVDVDEPAAPCVPVALQAPEQDAAVAAEHDRKGAPRERTGDVRGKFERERADRHAVTDAGAGLRLEHIGRMRKPRNARAQTGGEPGGEQRAWAAPRVGLAAGAVRLQAEAARRGDEFDRPNDAG